MMKKIAVSFWGKGIISRRSCVAPNGWIYQRSIKKDLERGRMGNMNEFEKEVLKKEENQDDENDLFYRKFQDEFNEFKTSIWMKFSFEGISDNEENVNNVKQILDKKRAEMKDKYINLRKKYLSSHTEGIQVYEELKKEYGDAEEEDASLEKSPSFKALQEVFRQRFGYELGKRKINDEEAELFLQFMDTKEGKELLEPLDNILSDDLLQGMDIDVDYLKQNPFIQKNEMERKKKKIEKKLIKKGMIPEDDDKLQLDIDEKEFEGLGEMDETILLMKKVVEKRSEQKQKDEIYRQMKAELNSKETSTSSKKKAKKDSKIDLLNKEIEKKKDESRAYASDSRLIEKINTESSKSITEPKAPIDFYDENSFEMFKHVLLKEAEKDPYTKELVEKEYGKDINDIIKDFEQVAKSEQLNKKFTSFELMEMYSEAKEDFQKGNLSNDELEFMKTYNEEKSKK